MQNLIREGPSWSGRERNCAFLNVGADPFANCSAISGFDFLDDGRGLAVGDWDFDGDLDAWVSNRTGPRLRFLRNDIGARSGFVALRLEGRSGNRDAIGARVEVTAAGKKRIRTLRAGEGFVAQSSKWMHFGLGAHRGPVDVRVRWPGGGVEVFRDLEAGRFWRLVEGEDVREWSPSRRPSALAASRPEAPPEPDTGRVFLAARPPLPALDAVTSDGSVRPLCEPGRPNLLTLWASWCAPCQTEAKELAARSEDWSRHELAIVPLIVDEEASRAKAFAALNRLGLGELARVAPKPTLEVLETVQRTVVSRRRPLALPTSFLLDSAGRIAAVYRGGISPDVLLADLENLPLEGRALRDAAIPFPGTWYSAPKDPPVEALARNSLIFGRLDIAMAFLRDALRGNPESASLHMTLGGIYASIGDDGAAIAHFQESARIDDRSVRVRLNLAEAYRRAGRFDESVAVYREAIRMDPGFPEARRGEILALVRLKRWHDAARSLEHALANAPDEEGLINLQARFLAACPVPELRDGTRALRLSEAALARGRSLEKAATLAMVCAELGRFEEAIRVQETALQVARRGGDEAVVRKLEQDLARYREGRACRVPWTDDHPLLQPPSLTLESATLIE
jgi:tetratricopeptide (TPR) repeat protein